MLERFSRQFVLIGLSNEKAKADAEKLKQGDGNVILRQAQDDKKRRAQDDRWNVTLSHTVTLSLSKSDKIADLKSLEGLILRQAQDDKKRQAQDDKKRRAHPSTSSG